MSSQQIPESIGTDSLVGKGMQEAGIESATLVPAIGVPEADDDLTVTYRTWFPGEDSGPSEALVYDVRSRSAEDPA